MTDKYHNVGRIIVSVLLGLVGLVFVAYVIAKSHRGGNDINVYLYAAEQLLLRRDLYELNPYNLYLYSPLFALMLTPFTFPDMSIARVIWALINVGLAIRLWYLLYGMTSDLTRSKKKYWSAAVIILSLGFLNHNFALGQVTILLLWLTLEGAYQVEHGKTVIGSVLIALGINIKIIPLLVLVYFGMRGHFKALTLSLLFFIGSLFLPALIIGFRYNAQLLVAWRSVINPSGGRFAFEDNDGCHSLNAVLPAYFFDFSTIERPVAPYKRNVDYPRRILAIPYDTLNIILQVCRITLIALFIIALLPRSWLGGPAPAAPKRFIQAWMQDFSNRRAKTAFFSRNFFWEIALLCLLTLLIFPHQMKYSMLYFVPTGAYIVRYFLDKNSSHQNWRLSDSLVLGISILLMLILAIMGRDIIGDHLVDILDYYHFIGFSNLIFVWILWYCKPARTSERPTPQPD